MADSSNPCWPGMNTPASYAVVAVGAASSGDAVRHCGVDAAEAAGVVSLSGTATCVGALAYLHVAPTGLSPVRNAVSQYGITAYRSWYRVQTVAMGIAAAALAVALSHDLAGPGTTAVVALVAVLAACRLAISWFPMDAPGSPRTSTGAAHGLLAIGAFLSAAIAAIRLAKLLGADASLDALATTSRVLGWAMAASLALLFLARLSPDLRRRFGLIERAFYVAILVWLVVVATACVTGHLGAEAARWRACGSGAGTCLGG